MSPGLQSIVLFFGSDRDRPTHITNRVGTEPQARTGLTVFGRKFNLDDLVGSVIDSWGPATACVSFWACSLLVFPIDKKVISIEACLLIRLPLMVPAGSRPAIWHLHSRYRQYAVLARAFVLKGFMDDRRSRIIRDRCRGGFHMCNKVRTLFFTGFGQMDIITDPGSAALLTVMRLDIVR